MNEAEFRPRLAGVVARDLGLARRLSQVHRGVIGDVEEGLLEAVRCADAVGGREACERQATAALEEAKLLGELIAALGVARSVRGSGAQREAKRTRVLRERIGAYEGLLGCTGDRVVRSVITRLITLARRELSALEG